MNFTSEGGVGEAIEVYLRCGDCLPVPLSILPTLTVLDLKGSVKNIIGMKTCFQKIRCRGMFLSDDVAQVSSFGVCSGDIVLVEWLPPCEVAKCIVDAESDGGSDDDDDE